MFQTGKAWTGGIFQNFTILDVSTVGRGTKNRENLLKLNMAAMLLHGTYLLTSDIAADTTVIVISKWTKLIQL